MTKITLIGSGNVAWQLGRALVKASHCIDAVYSRNSSNAKTLADSFLDCNVASTLDFSESNSELFIIAISDTAIEGVALELLIPENALVVHTAGSIPMEVLQKFPHYGVLYPLQTLTKEKGLDFSEVPFGIEASDDKSYQKLDVLAHTLSKNVQAITSAQRKVLHIAAVIACNFTNHLFSISEAILKKENLEFALLTPLIKETVEKALTIGPQKAQTGPALRGDEKVILQHLEYLKEQPELQELYTLMTNQIIKTKR